MPEIELAIVSETKATIAKARITTTTENPLLRHQKEGQVGFQTQPLRFQSDTTGKRKILSFREDKCQSEGTFCRL